ncbi:hypothetical protein HG531_012719 [Fusarium graminearum]|nr:hypothetical protein HG531_012719 [Fusarium graminearum]
MEKHAPLVVILWADRLNEDFEEIGTCLHTNNVQHTSLCLHEECLDIGLGVDIVTAWAHCLKLGGYQVVNGEDICHLDVQSRLVLGVKVVELVNVECSFGIWHRNHVASDLKETLDRLGNKGIQRLQVHVVATEWPTSSNLADDLGNFTEVSLLQGAERLLNYTNVLRSNNSWLQIESPKPVGNYLQQILRRLSLELLSKVLENLVAYKSETIWHLIPLLTDALEEPGKILWLRLQVEEELLVRFKLLAGALVERLEVELVGRGHGAVGDEVHGVTSIIVLMSDDFIQGDLVLDQKSNLDVELINIVLKHLVLSDLLDNGLADTLKLDFLVEVKVAIVQKVDKVLDSIHRRVLSGGQALVGLSLNLGANETLDLDDLLHLSHDILNSGTFHHGPEDALKIHDLGSMRVELLKESFVLLAVQESSDDNCNSLSFKHSSDKSLEINDCGFILLERIESISHISPHSGGANEGLQLLYIGGVLVKLRSQGLVLLTGAETTGESLESLHSRSVLVEFGSQCLIVLTNSKSTSKSLELFDIRNMLLKLRS